MSLPMFAPTGGISQIKHVLAVAACKGGVGKSVVTVYLARALSKKGLKIGILDADLYGPSIGRMILYDVLPSKTEQSLKPAFGEGIALFSSSYLQAEGQAVAARAPIVNRAITEFIETLDWGVLDLLLVDFPPGTGDLQITLCQKVKFAGALLVTLPCQVAVQDVKRAAQFFEQLSVPVLGVCENMSFYQEASGEKVALFGQGGGQRLAGQLQVPLLSCIPLDPRIGRAADLGKPLQDLELQDVFNALAQELLEKLNHFQSSATVPLSWVSISQDNWVVEWSDGVSLRYSPEKIQKACPCAYCQGKGEVSGPVFIEELLRVGEYGCRFTFNRGCCHGIYSFEMLYQLGEAT